MNEKENVEKRKILCILCLDLFCPGNLAHLWLNFEKRCNMPGLYCVSQTNTTLQYKDCCRVQMFWNFCSITSYIKVLDHCCLSGTLLVRYYIHFTYVHACLMSP